MLIRFDRSVALAVPLAFGVACASTGTPLTPLEDPDIRLAHTWLARTFSEVVERMGEPQSMGAHPDTKIWWWDRNLDLRSCRVTLDLDAEGTVVATRVRGTCPPLGELEALGWIQPIGTEGLISDYERFYQVYRIRTQPRLMELVDRDDRVELWFVGGFHRERPQEIVRGFVLRLPGDDPREDPDDVLRIPVAEEIRAEARLLVDDQEAFSMLAMEAIPLRGLTGIEDYLFLSLARPSANRLTWARTVDIRLPSGAELLLSPEEVRRLRQALLVLFDHERVRAAAGGS